MQRFVIEFVNLPFKKETLNVYISLTDFCELFSLVVTVYFSLLCKLTVSVTKHVLYNTTCLLIIKQKVILYLFCVL